MEIALDRTSRTPIHLQIALGIKELILKGAISEGGRLPPTRKLAATLGVNRSTVVQAYEKLWSEGLVESHVGRGTTVRSAEQGRSAAVSSPPWAMLFAPRAEALEIELRELSKLFDREGLVSLAAGLPGPDLYPVEEITRITCDVLAEEGRSLLQWCSLHGYTPLRRFLAEEIGVSPGEIMILTGSTQGLYLLARAFIEPGDFVVTEAPTYLGAIQAFRSAGARIVGIPLDEGTIDLEMLENSLARTQPKFIYVLPTFQNPTGATLSLERRRALLDLAYRYRIPVIEDDPYRELRYEGEAIPTLKALDTHGYVIHLGTFTKTLFPGLRVGWLAGPKPVVDQLVPAKHLLDIFTNSLAQAVIYRYLSEGLLQNHLKIVCAEYERRRDAATLALRRYCPGLRFDVPEGGYYIWCRLPRPLAARELLREGLREGISFLSGEVFYPDGRGQDRIRLTFTSQKPEVLTAAIKKLGTAIRRLKKRGTARQAQIETPATPLV